MTALSLGHVLQDRSLAVVAGTGGVGKTTVAAALGLAAGSAFDDGDVLVLTIDPARRLASALGLPIDGNEVIELPMPKHVDTDARVFAAMLDPSSAWDTMVRSEASDSQAARILANPVYRRIADTFVHGNDYAALGWLSGVVESGRYRLIIVDTPPSQNALDFFDAPQRVADFFGSPLLSWLTGGDGSIMGSAAARTFSNMADRLLGAEFFADVVEFFGLMSEVVPGMVARTGAVAAKLASNDAAFVAVTTPAVDVLARLDCLAEQLASRDLAFDGVVVNSVEPDIFAENKVLDVSQRVVDNDSSPFSTANTSLLTPGAEYVLERAQVARGQRLLLEQIPAEVVALLERVVDAPTSTVALFALGQRLWGTTGDTLA